MIGINKQTILRILPLARSTLIRLPTKNSVPHLQTFNRHQWLRSGYRSHNLIISQIRFNTTSSTPEQITQQQSDSQSERDDKKRTQIRKDVVKLLRLAKPEFRTLIFALLCLLVTSATTMSLPLFIGKIIDTAKPKEDEDGEVSTSKKDEPVIILGLPQVQFYSALGILFVVGAGANYGRLFLLRSVGERLVARLRSRIFLKILSQDAYFFDVGPTKAGMKTGDLISRIASDTQIISKSLSMNISDGMRAVISGCVGLSMMCFVSWKLTLCMSLMFPPLIVMSWFYGRRIKALSRLIQENVGAMTKVTEEKLNGVKTIQAFSQQLLMVRNYNGEIKNIFNSSMREAKYSGFYYSVNGFIGNTTLIGLLVVGVQLVGLGQLSIGDLSSFMMYAVYTGSSVFGLGNFYTELMKGIGAAERVFELVEYQPKIPVRLGRKVDGLNGDIKFEDINFTYPSRLDSEVFRHMNLTIKQGENVCLVGPSGCGKSTVSQLLLRFYDPDTGNVFIGNNNIRDLNLNHYRSQLGYVLQDAFLFSGSIKENVLFGKDDATDEQIQRALELSNAKSFISNLPHGLETPIGGSNSTQLSGGQRQRVSLARTLIREPKILILDEATSALDSISEEMVMKNLQQLNKELGVTIISIAHRLSTIKGSDRIVVFNDEGEIVEDDSFDVLFNDPTSEFNKLLKSHSLE